MDNRLFFPSTQKNKKYIGDILSRIPLEKGTILETGSGSCEHGIEFQKRFPEIIWQTSDPELKNRKSIISWIKHEKLCFQMPEPLNIDIMKIPWKIPYKLNKSLKGIISINVIHIAPWECTVSLFKQSSKFINNEKFLMLYGPFKIKNQHVSESNYFFDQSLRKKNSDWGVRNLEEVNEEAKINGFNQIDLIKMPANNIIMICRKTNLKS